ncbi:MAG: hypothetical protein IJY89_03790, partial [Clostridia bacterium]|nr:hypothetical protein [Clostridia bacterium]
MASIERARAEDLLRLAEKRGFAAGDFLTPADRAHRQAALAALKKEHSFTFSFEGGAPGCQRTLPVLLSSDLEGLAFADFAEIAPLYLKATDAAPLDHRSVLGALMALGLKRTVIGDIFKYEEGTVVFLKETVCPYVKEQLTRIGKSSVVIEDDFSLPPDFLLVYPKQELSYSVSSLRLDCLVSAICKCSRDTGAEMVKKGLVSVNYEEQTA